MCWLRWNSKRACRRKNCWQGFRASFQLPSINTRLTDAFRTELSTKDFTWVLSGQSLLASWRASIAKFIMPGDNEPSGFILTTILGIVGAFVATFLGQASAGIGLVRAQA